MKCEQNDDLKSSNNTLAPNLFDSADLRVMLSANEMWAAIKKEEQGLITTQKAGNIVI